MSLFPPMPELPRDHVGEASYDLRYEDVAQDGRLMLNALPPAVGPAVWRAVLPHHPISKTYREQDLTPILSRLTLEGTEAAVRLDCPAQARGGFQAAHAVDATGAVDRLFLNMWVEVSGSAGRLYPREGPGAPVVAGRVFAEHTFTRLFAPAGERKVTRLTVDGVDPVPAALHAYQPPATAGELPPGAVALDDVATPDPAPLRFGLDHTDSNQHVNSLVYPWLFTEAALRRLDAHGLGGKWLVRFVDMTYRKPCFAGDRVVVVMRAFRIGERVGAAGWIVPADRPGASPYCYGRLIFA